jgi:hypothetical protein
LAEFFRVSVAELLDDVRELPADPTEVRFSQAKEAADRAEARVPGTGQIVFEKTLERSAYAENLRIHARRLAEQAKEMKQLADQIEGRPKAEILLEHAFVDPPISPSVKTEHEDAAKKLAELKRQAAEEKMIQSETQRRRA